MRRSQMGWRPSRPTSWKASKIICFRQQGFESYCTKELRDKKENIISNQIGRSATSVCANIAESKYGHSRADFIAKLEITLKEASETGKWLKMLYKTNYIDETKYKSIDKICSTIRILLIASIKTAKQNQDKNK